MDVYIVLRHAGDVMLGHVFKSLDDAMAWCVDCTDGVGVRLVWKSSPGCGLQSWTAHTAGGYDWVIESRRLIP